MGLSAAQASGMAARMARMADMAMSDHGGCQDCPEQSGDSGMKGMACGNVCAAPVIAPLPLAATVPAGRKLAFEVAPDLFLNGRTLPPDPDPPRTSDIA
jgi:hypothetical protein